MFKYLTITNTPTAELLFLLNNNFIGTPNKSMVYKHMKVNEKVKNIKNPYFINLVRGNDILGTCCFCSRMTLNSDIPYNSYYIRYFTFKEQFRRKSISNRDGRNRKSTLKKEVEKVLEGFGLGELRKEKFFLYAYVDPNNERSVSLCNAYGFKTIRQFSTILFNRFYPKASNRICRIGFDESNGVKDILGQYYKEYNMLSFENFNSNSYYVIKDSNGSILAGVQANRDYWTIKELPGISGKIILKGLAKLPILDKVINEDYHFLSFEYIYIKEGHEQVLEELFEGLLALHKVFTSMLWVDKDTSLYHSLKTLRLGLVNKINKEVNLSVIARFVGFSDQEINIFKKNPSYISAIDQT